MDEMQLFCIADINCPPVELERTKDGFCYNFILKKPPPRFMVLFSQGKWLDSAENLQLEANLIVGNNTQEFGVLSKTNKSIMKEVNLDSLLKKKTIQARLDVKAINTHTSKTSDETNQETKNVPSADAKPKDNLEKKETIQLKSEDQNKIKNSSDKSDTNQKEKKTVPCDKKKTPQEKITSSRKDRNLKEVENLRNPKEIIEKSSDKSKIEIAQSDDSKSTLGGKKIKKLATKNSKEVTCDKKSEIPDPDMKEVKENVPKATSSQAVGKTKSLRSGLSQKNKEDQSGKQESSDADKKEQKVKKESKSKDEDLSETSGNEKSGKKPNAGKTEQKLVKAKKLPSKDVNTKMPDSKTDAGKKKYIKKQSKPSSNAENNQQDPKKGSIDINKNNVDKENGKKQKEVSSKKEQSKPKESVGSKSSSNIVGRENVPQKTTSISRLVKLTPVKSEIIKEEFRKKVAAKSKISKDTVKTKQTILQFKSLGFAEKNKEKSILKESGTPSKKRKLSVSFNNQPKEENLDETQLINDCKEAETQLDETPKRITRTVSEPEVQLKDTEALMKINSDSIDIENEKNLDQKENSVDTLTTPHLKNSCKTPSPPKPPQKCKNKRVRFDATPDSGSTPKKRSPKRIRTLKNEFAKSNLLLSKESSKKHPATCKDVTDRSCHPSERWGPTLSMVSPNKAILIGGQGEKQVLNKDSVWSLNPETRKWKQLETKSVGPRPDLRMGHTATYDPTVRCIYVYGGSKNLKWFNDVHALDVDEKVWQLVKVTGKAPTRAYHTACLYRHEIWIFGGVYPNPDPQPDGCSNEIHVFSPVMGNWYMPVVTGEKPAARSGHSATIIKEEMVVFGGWDFPYCFNDIYILDLSLVEWRKPETKGTPPKPRSWHASCALSHSRVLIHGGYDGNIALDDIHIFDVATMCWMEILFTCSPVPRAGHTCLCLPFTSANEDDDEVLIFGGGDNEKTFFGDLFSINVPFRPAIKVAKQNGDLNSTQVSTVS